MKTVKYILGGIATVVGLILIIGIITTGNAFYQAGIAKITAAPRVTQEVYNPNNILNQVSFFTQTCANVERDFGIWKTNQEGYERAINLTKVARDQGELTQAENEASQLSSEVQGALSNLQSDAADYNARSKNYTANPFKVAGLPYRIVVPNNSTSLTTWSPPNCG